MRMASRESRFRSGPLSAASAAVALLSFGACASSAWAQGALHGIEAQAGKAQDVAQANGNAEPEKNDPVLRVCADPSELPMSNDRGEGYENKIAEALAKDLGKKTQYTYFPQRMGFVRNTLRARDETTFRYKCDLIIGVPKGYDVTATT